MCATSASAHPIGDRSPNYVLLISPGWFEQLTEWAQS
jgi:hypothetical protein